MANAGRVEVNFQVKGEDQISATLKKVNDEAFKTNLAFERMAAKAEVAARSQDNLNSKLRSTVSGFDKLIKPLDDAGKKIGGFLNKVVGLPGPMGLVTGGVAAIGGAIIGLVADLFSFDKKVDGTVAKLKAMEDKARSAKEEFDRLSKSALAALAASGGSQGKILATRRAAAVARGDTAEAARLEREEALEKVREDIAVQQKTLDETNKIVSDAEKRVDDTLKAEEKARQMLDAALTSQMNAQQNRNFKMAEQAKARAEAAEATLRVLEVNRKMAEDAYAAASEAAFRTIDQIEELDILLTETARAPMSPKAKESPNKAPDDKSKPTGQAKPKPVPEVIQDIENIGDAILVVEDATADFEALLAPLRDWSAIRDEAEQTADTFRKLFDIIEGGARAAFPEMADGLAEVDGLLQGYTKRVQELDKAVHEGLVTATQAQAQAQADLTQTIIGGSTAIAASVAKTLGGLQAEYAVRSAGEFAAGVASAAAYDYVAAAQHFSASALYGVAAAKAGGGGGGGARGGGGGGSGGTGGGPAKTKASEGGVIVYNFNQLTAEGFGVKKAVRQLNARRDRSGYAQRAGV
jgi:hypothetical protein